jgi:hypothetical protein
MNLLIDMSILCLVSLLSFTEPVGLSVTLDVKQPSMLKCQLKAYQLKGLNWLVNLYEQVELIMSFEWLKK